MTIASAFNDIAAAQGGTVSENGSIASAIDALNDALAGSDQPAASTIEGAVRLLGQHIGSGGGDGGGATVGNIVAFGIVNEGTPTNGSEVFNRTTDGPLFLSLGGHPLWEFEQDGYPVYLTTESGIAAGIEVSTYGGGASSQSATPVCGVCVYELDDGDGGSTVYKNVTPVDTPISAEVVEAMGLTLIMVTFTVPDITLSQGQYLDVYAYDPDFSA